MIVASHPSGGGGSGGFAFGGGESQNEIDQ